MSNASLGTEIKCQIGKALGTFACLTARVWENQKLSIWPKANVYCFYVWSTLLYGSNVRRRGEENKQFLPTCLCRTSCVGLVMF